MAASPPTALADDDRALARALSAVERGGADAEETLRAVRGRTGRARTVGLTGAPGVGKSTLAQRLGLALVQRGERVAVLAVDPSSPFSGGALLGDRIRMSEFLAAGGFVRSMAARGAPGGLALATADAVDVLDAAGFAWVLLETVGAGQDEVAVAGEVETVVVVTAAGLGDDVQAAKAGLMEIAHVFAVNKADRPGAEAQVATIRGMLSLVPAPGWSPPVVATSATEGSGVERLLAAVLDHQAYLDGGGRREERRRRRASGRVERALDALLRERLQAVHGAAVAEAARAVAEGSSDPYRAARGVLAKLLREGA